MLGLHCFYTGRLEEAERHLRDAIDLLPASVGRVSGGRQSTGPARSWYHDLAELLTAMGRLEEAEEARRAVGGRHGSRPSRPPPPPSRTEKVSRTTGWENCSTQTGRTDEAGSSSTQAASDHGRSLAPPAQGTDLPVAADLPAGQLPRSGAPRSRRGRSPWPSVSCRQSTGHYWRYLALAQYRSEHWQAAADSIQQAMDLRQGGDAFDWLLLAMAHWQLGQKDAALERYTQAQEAIEAGKPLFYEYLGVMAVQRLQREAEMLMGEGIEGAEEGTEGGAEY